MVTPPAAARCCSRAATRASSIPAGFPLEHLKKTMRRTTELLRRRSPLCYQCRELFLGLRPGDGPQDEATADLARRRFHQLTSLVSRLQGLKRKLEEGGRAENLQVQRCRGRLNHLDALTLDSQAEWNSNRLRRVLVDYMLRMSYYETAEKLAISAGYRRSSKRRSGPALAWCAENKTRLKKSKSTLEFQLRLQEFIELVRVDSNMQAIVYARKHLALWAASHMKELQRVMATWPFKSNTECATYKVGFLVCYIIALSFYLIRCCLSRSNGTVLSSCSSWSFANIYGMTLEPLLNIYLQAGLTALKTPFCYEENCTKEDPLSQESFRRLATSLPFSKQQNSKLVCYITKELMDTENPPLVLPNGYVYSTKTMAKRNDGKIICPRTGYACNFSELIKAFIS
ncbi:unnamed protein product [Spirodela intermedia]|uniref:Macrophage erythroblast attacher n=1 Tax=Spirodela intermedia TaxID=51605 RepID=A0ABN7EDV9_SPIIN|nr:unnamed protein product [Spirodela intermedia]